MKRLILRWRRVEEIFEITSTGSEKLFLTQNDIFRKEEQGIEWGMGTGNANANIILLEKVSLLSQNSILNMRRAIFN